MVDVSTPVDSTRATLALRPMRDLFPFGARDAPLGAFTL
jgi:hypothetical protein